MLNSFSACSRIAAFSRTNFSWTSRSHARRPPENPSWAGDIRPIPWRRRRRRNLPRLEHARQLDDDLLANLRRGNRLRSFRSFLLILRFRLGFFGNLGFLGTLKQNRRLKRFVIVIRFGRDRWSRLFSFGWSDRILCAEARQRRELRHFGETERDPQLRRAIANFADRGAHRTRARSTRSSAASSNPTSIAVSKTSIVPTELKCALRSVAAQMPRIPPEPSGNPVGEPGRR